MFFGRTNFASPRRPEPFRIVKLPVSWSDSLSTAEQEGFKVTARSPDGSVLSGNMVVDGQVLLLPENLDNAEGKVAITLQALRQVDITIFWYI